MSKKQIGSREFYRLAVCCDIAQSELMVFILRNLNLLPNVVQTLYQKILENQSILAKQDRENQPLTRISDGLTRLALGNLEQDTFRQIELIKIHEIHTFITGQQPHNMALLNLVQQNPNLLTELLHVSVIHHQYHFAEIQALLPKIQSPQVQEALRDMQAAPQPQPQNPVAAAPTRNIGSRRRF